MGVAFYFLHAALPQLDRGPDYESGRHRFESCTPHHETAGQGLKPLAFFHVYTSPVHLLYTSPYFCARKSPTWADAGLAQAGGYGGCPLHLFYHAGSCSQGAGCPIGHALAPLYDQRPTYTRGVLDHGGRYPVRCLLAPLHDQRQFMRGGFHNRRNQHVGWYVPLPTAQALCA